MQISTTMAIDRKIPNTLLSLSSVLIFDLAVFTGDCIRLHRDNHALNRYFIDFRKDRPIEAVNELHPSSSQTNICLWQTKLSSSQTNIRLRQANVSSARTQLVLVRRKTHCFVTSFAL